MTVVIVLLLALVALIWFFLNCLIPGEMTLIYAVSIDLFLFGNVTKASSDLEMVLSC